MAFEGDKDEEKGGTTWKDAVIPVILILLFVLAFAIRGVFYWGPAVAPIKTYGDQAYLLSGNDPDYHKVSIDYTQETHRQQIFDPKLDFPAGAPNANPPLWSWSVALMGYALAPFFHGDIYTATFVFFEWSAAFWAALTIFPVYVIARDMFGKKSGLWAAFFLSVMAGSIERTPVGFSDHDAFYVFFIVLTFLFLMRALRMLNTKTYVKDYFNARSLATGTRDLLADNKKAFLYAMLASISMTAVALAWKGDLYIMAILMVYLVFHLVVKKFKKEEGLGIALIVLLVIGFSLAASFPYYRIDYYTYWMESPIFAYVALCVLVILLVPTRDLPWLITVPLIAALVFGGIFGLTKVFPEIMKSVLDLQGYFIKSKLYETIAEAQAPDFSRMVFTYGVMTFYMALIATAWAIYKIPSEKWRNDYIMIVVWAFASIAMALSATRFMYNATPVFAVMGGWATYALIKMTGYDEMIRTYDGLKTDRLYAIKKSVKPRHVLTAVFVVFLIIWPNFWYGLDAGIPFESKKKYDQQLHDFLPAAMRPTASQYSSASGEWWLGSFGTDYPNDYWVDGLYWLADQDTDKIPVERPGFISWWDYGHWATHMGQHPSAADNFQDGFQWAGNFIASQNESEAVALTAVKIIDGNMYRDKYVLDILQNYIGKENRDKYWNYSIHPADYTKHVLQNPQIYGPHSPDRTDRVNIKWLMTSRLLMANLNLERLVELNHDLETYTGNTLRYFAMDTRLLPAGPRNTGIYYAPIKLADDNIDDYLIVWAVGTDGSRTNVNDVAAMRAKQEETGYTLDHYEIEYSNRFYNSMFYRCYIGWKPADAEIGEQGIPIVTRAADVGLQNLQIAQMGPMQGWGMQHYRLEYRTIYWNPNATNPNAHSGDWKIVTPAQAKQYENWSKSSDTTLKEKAGILDPSYRGLFNGVFFLKYYDGAFINGTVTLNDGTPLAGVRVTVYDDTELTDYPFPGIPHGYTYTDENGQYSIVAPYGNVTIRYTNGGQDAASSTASDRVYELLSQSDKRLLNESNVNITDNQAMRVKEDRNGDGIWDYNIRHDVAINNSSVKGTAFWDVNYDRINDKSVDQPLDGMMALTGSHYNRNMTTNVTNGTYEFTKVIPDTYNISYVPRTGQQFQVATSISVDPSTPVTQEILITPANLSGTVFRPNGTGVQGVHMVLAQLNNSIIYDLTSGVNGTYSVPRLLKGNYTLKVDDVRYSALAGSVDVETGENYTQNITVTGAVGLTGTARLPDGSPASGGILIARNVMNDELSAELTIGPDGKIQGYLAPGNYSVNGKVIKGADTYVYMERLDLEKVSGINITFRKAFKLNGTLYADLNNNGMYDKPNPSTNTSGMVGTVNEARSDISVEFDGPLGNISLVSNKNGYFEVYLVPGTYTAYIYSTIASDNQTGLSAIKMSGDRTMDLVVGMGTTFTGTVFYDKNLNGMVDQGEALDGAAVSFDTGTTTLVKHSGRDGILTLNLLQATYTVGVQYAGYTSYGESIVMQGSELHKNIVLNPSNITVTGLVGVDADGNGRIGPGEGVDVIMQFVPDDATGGAATISIESKANGTFRTALIPVNYTVEIDQTVSTPDGGEVRYSYSKQMPLAIGQGAIDLNVALNKMYKVSGNIYYDTNGNGILNLGERRSPQLTFYGTDDKPLDPTVSTDGYVIYLTAGTYYYYAHMGEAASPSKEAVALGKVSIDSTTKLDLRLVPGTRLNGVVYFDDNNNQLVDSGEQQDNVVIRVSEMIGEATIGTVTTYTSQLGEYSLYIPWDINYTLTIDNTQQRTYAGSPYNVKYSFQKRISAPAGQDTIVLDLSIDKFYSIWGNVTYVSPTGPVKLGGAVIKYGTFSTTSNADGSYRLLVRPGKYPATVDLAGFTLPTSTYGNRTVDYDTPEQNFVLDPKNVTLRGHIFVDLDHDGKMDSKDEGIQAEALDFIAAGNRAINASATTDQWGMFTVNLKPGSYYTWAQASSGIYHYVTLMRFDLNASGSVVLHDFQVREGLALQGSIYLLNTDHKQVVPIGVNITLEQNRTGIQRTLRITTSGYIYYLPVGQFNLTAKYQDREYGQAMDYLLDIKANMTERTQMDLVFQKVKHYYTDVTWDPTEKATLSQNTSVTYHFKIKNVGNEPGTWEIFGSPPTDWKTTPSTTSISLAIGETKSFSVLINVSKNAKAGDNPIYVGSKITEVEAYNSTTAYVNVKQVYNISLTRSSTATQAEADNKYTYVLTLKNDGNGLDKVNIQLMTMFPGWNVTVTNPNPTVDQGQTLDINIIVTPVNQTIGRPMQMLFRATSQGGVKSDYVMAVSFPDLLGDMSVSGPGVKVQKTTTQKGLIPGFEPMLAVAAISVACAAIYIRRRGGGAR